MNMEVILKYLTGLRDNNSREWYHAHKAEYQAANAEFEALLQALIDNIGAFDPSVLHNTPQALTFKLNRDIRFSHNKAPYNPAFRAHMAPMGKLPIPVGYYLMMKPDDQSFLGGGLFADMFKEATTMVRDYITQNGERLEEILTDAEFKKHFIVRGASLKNVPAGYDKEHPQAEFLKFKSWYLEYPIKDAEMANTEAFIAQATELFRLMKPFNDYLNEALAEF